MPLLLQGFVLAVLIGLVAFLVCRFVPMSPGVKSMVETGAMVVVGIILFVVLLAWICQIFGWSTGMQPVKLW